MAAIAILVLIFVVNPSSAETVDVTKTSILSKDTQVNDPIKLKQAFAQVLAKNTGENLESILQNPVFMQTNITRGIKRSYFEKIDSQYLSEHSPYHYWFHIVFQENFLKQMIAEAGFSLLPVNRKKVIIWMVREDDTLLDVSLNSTIQTPSLLKYIEDDARVKYWLNHWADALGLTVVFPQMDADDKSQVTKESIKTLSFQAVDQSMNKYAVNQILMLYIKTAANYLRIRSGFISHEDDIIINHYQEPVVDLGSLMYSLMANIAETTFQKSRIDSSGLLKHNIRVVINGIENYDRVIQIQSYLSGLSVIEAYDIQSASNGQLVLNVELLIKTAIFIQLIEDDNQLIYQQDSPTNQLYFQVIDE